MMGNFEKFNETLYISRGEKFVASLGLKWDTGFHYYEIMNWFLVVREKDCFHERVLGKFTRKEDQSHDFKYDLERKYDLESKRNLEYIPYPHPNVQVRSVIEESFEGKLWDSLQDIISRSQDLLRALEYS